MNQPKNIFKSLGWLLVVTVFVAGCASDGSQPLKIGWLSIGGPDEEIAASDGRFVESDAMPTAPRPEEVANAEQTSEEMVSAENADAQDEEIEEEMPNPLEMLVFMGRSLGLPLGGGDEEEVAAETDLAKSDATESPVEADTNRSEQPQTGILAAERIGQINPPYATNAQAAETSSLAENNTTSTPPVLMVAQPSIQTQTSPADDLTGGKKFAELQQQVDEVRRNVQERRDMAEFLAAEQAFENGNYTSAKQGLILLLRRNPQHREARLLLIDLCLRNADYSTGTAHGELAVQYFPNDPEAHHALALVLDAGNRLEDAIKSYKKAVDLAPKNELYMSAYYTALDQLKQQNMKQTDKVIVTRESNDPSFDKQLVNHMSQPQRGDMDSSAGSAYDLPEANAQTSPLTRPAQVQSPYAIPEAPLEVKTDAPAVPSPYAIPQASPQVVPYSSQTVRPLPPLQVTEHTSNNSQTSQSQSQQPAQAAQSTELVQSTQSESAVEKTSATTDTEIDLAHSAPVASLLERGKAELKAGRPDPGLTFFRKAMDLEPNNVKILIDASAAALRLNHPSVTLDLIEPRLDQFPESVPIRHIFGMAYYHRGNYPRAEAVFTEAVSLDKSNALSYALLGYASAALGKTETAAWSRQRALELDPRIAQPLQANRTASSTPADSVVR